MPFYDSDLPSPHDMQGGIKLKLKNPDGPQIHQYLLKPVSTWQKVLVLKWGSR